MNDHAIAHTHHDPLHPDIITSLVLDGDIARLNNHQRVAYYVHRCNHLGIDPGVQPFQLLKLSGKLVLYPKKECAQELTRIHRLSVEIRSKEIDADNIMTVCARAIGPDGVFVDDEGVVDLTAEGAKIGLSNARMKCVTKAKRRAVLAKCGLGGTEAADIPGARVYDMDLATGELEEAPQEHDAIDVDMTPSDRVVHLVATIANNNGLDKRVVYTAAVEGSGIPIAEYDNGWATPAELTEEDARAVASWLELNRKMKRSTTSEAKPRARVPQNIRAVDDQDIPF